MLVSPSKPRVPDTLADDITGVLIQEAKERALNRNAIVALRRYCVPSCLCALCGHILCLSCSPVVCCGELSYCNKDPGSKLAIVGSQLPTITCDNRIIFSSDVEKTILVASTAVEACVCDRAFFTHMHYGTLYPEFMGRVVGRS